MPAIEVDLPDGSVAEFPEGTPHAVMQAALQKHFGAPKGAQPDAAAADDPLYRQELSKARAGWDRPRIPGPEGVGAPATPEAAAFEAVQRQRGIDQQQAAFDATRTPGRRLGDIAAFGASLPVRAATRGEYGLGDVAQKIEGRDPRGPSQLAKLLAQHEGSFVAANQTGNYGFNLENLAALGDVTAGIPMLSTMGGVPGQMLRSMGGATRQLPGMMRKLASEERGAGINPFDPPKGFSAVYDQNGKFVAHMNEQGRKTYEASQGQPPAGGVQPGAPGAKAGTPIYDAAGRVSHYVDQSGNPIVPDAQAKAPPTRGESIAAGERIGVDMSSPMLTGNRVDRFIAGGMSGVPIMGSPIVGAYERGVQQIGDAAARAVAGLGTPGAEMAGAGAKTGIVDWIAKASAEHLENQYSGVSKVLRQGVTGDLTATRRVVSELQARMAESTSKTPIPAIAMVEDAVTRPGGLTFDGLKELRTDVIAKLEAAKITPEAGTSIPALKQIRGALTADLRSLAQKAGGAAGLRAFEKANSLAIDFSVKRKMLSEVVGQKGNVGEEAVIRKVHQLASYNTGGVRNLRLVRETIGPKAWGNVAAEIASRMGIDDTGLFSGERYLTAYGKLSDAGKSELFGGARAMFDDIQIVASKYRDLARLGNPSGTGRTNLVVKLFTDPKAALGLGAVAGAGFMAAPGVALAAVAPTLAGLMAGRRYAWYLSRPRVAGEAGKVIKSYFAVERAFGSGVEAVASREAALAQTIRSFALAVAQETGDSADSIEAALKARVEAIRRGQQ